MFHINSLTLQVKMIYVIPHDFYTVKLEFRVYREYLQNYKNKTIFVLYSFATNDIIVANEKDARDISEYFNFKTRGIHRIR